MFRRRSRTDDDAAPFAGEESGDGASPRPDDAAATAAASPFGPVSDPFGGSGGPHSSSGSGPASSPAFAGRSAPVGAAGATALLEPAPVPPPELTDPAPQPSPRPAGSPTVGPVPKALTPDDAAPTDTPPTDTPPTETPPGETRPGEAVAAAPAPTGSAPVTDSLPVHVDRRQLPPDLLRLKLAAQDTLVERMGARLYDRTLLDDQIEDLVGGELSAFLTERNVDLDDDDRLLFTEEVINDLLRHGPIEPYLRDDTVSEVMVNGLESIYVERNGRLQETSSRFLTEAHLRQIIERIVSKVGRRIDESSPMVDARLPDGSRVNAVIPPLAVDGPSLTIRKFAKDALGVDDLVRFGTLDRLSVEFLAACVRGRLNVLVSGGTGTGKTTLLNTLSSFIPDDERIVTIEDAVELQLHQRHIVRLESRPANVEGKGQVSIRDLVRNSLRMRPDRVIIGECRGGEALDMLQAMNTGHDGSLSTLHANGPRDALSRLETLCLMAGMDLPMRAIREQIASAVHLIVHVARLRDGSRKVTHITEVVGLEGEVITLSDIFTFDFDAGFDEEGRYLGTLQPTGLVPGVVRKLEEHGVHISSDLFDTGEQW